MYKIISDTSCDLRKDEIRDLGIEYVPFKISIDGKDYTDDENLNLDEFLEVMKKQKIQFTQHVHLLMIILK